MSETHGLSAPRTGFHSRIARHEAYHTLSLVEPQLRPEDTVLDVGCGAGYLAWLLTQRREAPVHALDIIDQRRAPVDHFELFDGIHLPVATASYDAVVLSFVLHHVPDPDKPRLLAEIRRVIRRTVIVLEDTPRTWFDRMLSQHHGESFRQQIGSTASFGFLDRAGWEELFHDLGYQLLVSQELGRFCRDWTQPFARSLFVLA